MEYRHTDPPRMKDGRPLPPSPEESLAYTILDLAYACDLHLQSQWPRATPSISVWPLTTGQKRAALDVGASRILTGDPLPAETPELAILDAFHALLPKDAADRLNARWSVVAKAREGFERVAHVLRAAGPTGGDHYKILYARCLRMILRGEAWSLRVNWTRHAPPDPQYPQLPGAAVSKVELLVASVHQHVEHRLDAHVLERRGSPPVLDRFGLDCQIAARTCATALAVYDNLGAYEIFLRGGVDNPDT